MNNKKSVTLVSSQELKFAQKDCNARLEQDLNIEISTVDNIPDLFPMLSDPCFHTDLITIAIESLTDCRDGVDIFDLVNTLSTLIKCTVSRTGAGRPVRRDTKIGILIRETTDPKLIRQVMTIPDVYLGTLYSGSWHYDMVRDDVARKLAGDFATPRHIAALLKPKKTQTDKKDEIALTPREQQILTLIQDRGASNKIIAKMLGISESTVKLHIGKVFKKYGVKNRTQLALFSKKNLKNKTEVVYARRSTDRVSIVA